MRRGSARTATGENEDTVRQESLDKEEVGYRNLVEEPSGRKKPARQSLAMRSAAGAGTTFALRWPRGPR